MLLDGETVDRVADYLAGVAGGMGVPNVSRAEASAAATAINAYIAGLERVRRPRNEAEED